MLPRESLSFGIQYSAEHETSTGQSKETSFPQVTTGQLELCLRAQGLRLDRGVLNRWAGNDMNTIMEVVLKSMVVTVMPILMVMAIYKGGPGPRTR